MKYSILFTAIMLTLVGCSEDQNRADAYGNFEATITTVSAMANGQLITLEVDEGDRIAAGQQVGLVDTTLLHLQRAQVLATINTLPQKTRTAVADIRVLEDQKSNLLRERDRVARLVERKAATSKQLDDLNGELAVIDQRVAAVRSSVQTANRGILAEQGPLLAQVDLLDEQIRKAYVYNPVTGTVITQMAEASEMVATGSPLYRIADLDTLTLRAYAGSIALQSVAIGQKVDVLIDQGTDSYETLSGTVSWIANEAEFTPKTIQTKEDRQTLVYALKIAVPNPDGRLKIGMPAEVNFPGSTKE